MEINVFKDAGDGVVSLKMLDLQPFGIPVEFLKGFVAFFLRDAGDNHHFDVGRIGITQLLKNETDLLTPP